MTKFLLSFAATAALAAASTFTGIITESMCVKNHSSMKMGPDADCVRACVKADKNVKYVLFDGKNTYNSATRTRRRPSPLDV